MAGQVPSLRLLLPEEEIRERLRVRRSYAGHVVPALIRLKTEISAEGDHSHRVIYGEKVPQCADELVLGRGRRSQLRRSVFGSTVRVLNRSGHVSLRSHGHDIGYGSRRQGVKIGRRLTEFRSAASQGFLIGDGP